MRYGGERTGGTTRAILAWVGLLLMAASLIWLQLWPESWQPVATSVPATPEDFFALVVLDPGHGGTDSGAMCAGVLEKDLTLDVAQRVQRLVHLQGFETVLTRQGDNYVSLSDRTAFANRQHDCIFVSIHFNDGKLEASSGVETYYAARQSDRGISFPSWLPFLQRTASQSPNLRSQSLASFIQDALVVRTQAVNRGTKAEQFHVIANVRHPAVLVEGGFLTNKADVVKLESGEYREQMAAAICEGILHYRDALRSRQPALAVTTPGG
jgi:N-acetylmuramoyl-L-alanine amidase